MRALWWILSALLVVAGLRARARRRASIRGAVPSVDDAGVLSIVESGSLSDDADEPLDPDEIRAEEERFWSEPWDEPEEV
jgi:hypothetical protein